MILRIIFVEFHHIKGKTGQNDLCPVLSLPVMGIRRIPTDEF